MATTSPLAGDRHFSGMLTRMVVEYLRAGAPQGALEAVLAVAAPVPSAEILCDDTAWISYGEFRRLLEATAAVLGGPESIVEIVATASLMGGSTPQAVAEFSDHDSVDLLLGQVFQSGSGLDTVTIVAGKKVAPGEWLLWHRLRDGYEPFRAFCAFNRGSALVLLRMFAVSGAEVVEEACCLDGAPECQFRLRWNIETTDRNRAEHFQTRSELLEARLDGLGRTVGELVSAADLEEALARIVASAATAVAAPAYVLAIDHESLGGRRVHAIGLSDVDAAGIADTLLADVAADPTNRLVAPVTSKRAAYGYLAAVRGDNRGFSSQQGFVLEVYARLAAAALDSATSLEDARRALEESRRQAATAEALLALSSSLAEIVSSQEMATKVVRAVRGIIDCDSAIVGLRETDTGSLRVAATSGYPDDVDREARASSFSGSTTGPASTELHYHDVTQCPHPDPLVQALMVRSDSVAVLSIPIVSGGELLGVIAATVNQDPERLRPDPLLFERLRGLAGQAAVAVLNARLMEQIRHQALHDTLTGLPNRAVIVDRANQMLARGRRQRTPVAALFIDLDGFKDVNDSVGHDAGDHLLVAVATRLSAAMRESDTIGRLGGDEFVVLVEGDSLGAGPELVAERLLEVLSAPFEIGEGVGGSFAVTASIGIATGDRLSAVELLRDADVALYQAKAAGKNCFVVFRSEMQTAVQDRLELETDLRGALAAGQFFLVYQPILGLSDREVIGVEALLRWRHPLRGVVQPDMFIPALEDTGLIVAVGRWVLEEACRQVAELKQGNVGLRLSVNVSARQLQLDRFVDDVKAALDSSGLAADLLVLEITESTIMRDAVATTRRLRALKALGVRIAIDDFGTGYSSLAYLLQFPVDALKIDRSFVSALFDSAEAGSLIRTVVQLGKSLGLEIVAEGIEDDDQHQYLQRAGCDSGQGFLFARPLEVPALEAYLALAWSVGDIGV